MDKLQFCHRCVWLDGRPIRFDGRPYLAPIYSSDRRYLVLRCSRQTEKSTFLLNTILHAACTQPGICILFVCPREEQAEVFVRTRLFRAIEQSGLVWRVLRGRFRGRQSVKNIEFANGSTVFVRSAFREADACRGVSIDLLLVDEFQDIAPGMLPVIEETMSHAPQPRTILTGTPKGVDNHLEAMFHRTTANEYAVACPNCLREVRLDERTLGPTGPQCPDCRGPLDRFAGHWVPQHPDATLGDGFSMNHLMVPWVSYDSILDRQATYSIGTFKNEVLGLPTTLGDHVVTRAELEACCRELPMAQTRADIPPPGRRTLVAGIDWGGGGTSRTVLVLGFMRPDYVFQICRLERFPASEDPEVVLAAVAERCQRFQAALIAADGGGNGSVYNRLLVDRVKPRNRLWAVTYSATSHPPQAEGALMKWLIDRTASIGVLFSRVKRQQILFPRVEDCSSYLGEFACEVAEFDDINRTVKYTHPQTMPDDALHATNYALCLATYQHSRRS